MKFKFIPSLITTAVLAAPVLLTSMSATAHGWVEYPGARQNICYLDGGFWDGTIPNAACQAAYDVSGAFPFVQRNELSANVANYHDMAAVRAVVQDGTLCSAGDSAKAGLDVGSSDWQRTIVTPDGNHQIELVFHATAVHNPSYWQFYLSRPGYDTSAALTWSDLELIDTAGNVNAGEDKKYRIKVTLPADRSGDAVLYTRWQREDPAGEGFYNCSDITLSSEGDNGPVDPENPTDPAGNLADLGYFVPQGFGPVESGDTVRFRTFDHSGSEIHDIRLTITANNSATWAAELAGQFNQLTDGTWYAGIWSDAMGHYMFNTANIYSNRVFAPAAADSYQLSLIKGGTTPPTDPGNTWQADTVYEAGDIVSHNGREWTAQWWTKGEEPGTTGEWGVWR